MAGAGYRQAAIGPVKHSPSAPKVGNQPLYRESAGDEQRHNGQAERQLPPRLKGTAEADNAGT